MVNKDHRLSVRRQCALLALSRSNLYYEPKGESAENLQLMEIIDKQFLETPWYGSRQMARFMQRQGYLCGRHRVRRLMRFMRLVPIYQEPNTSKKHPRHKIWPYLLRKMTINRPNQVWCADITYIPKRRSYIFDQFAARIRWNGLTFMPQISVVVLYFHRLHLASRCHAWNEVVQRCNS